MDVNNRRQPCILHLAGITLADYTAIEDMFDKKVLQNAFSRMERGFEALRRLVSFGRSSFQLKVS